MCDDNEKRQHVNLSSSCFIVPEMITRTCQQKYKRRTVHGVHKTERQLDWSRSLPLDFCTPHSVTAPKQAHNHTTIPIGPPNFMLSNLTNSFLRQSMRWESQANRQGLYLLLPDHFLHDILKKAHNCQIFHTLQVRTQVVFNGLTNFDPTRTKNTSPNTVTLPHRAAPPQRKTKCRLWLYIYFFIFSIHFTFKKIVFCVFCFVFFFLFFFFFTFLLLKFFSFFHFSNFSFLHFIILNLFFVVFFVFSLFSCPSSLKHRFFLHKS